MTLAYEQLYAVVVTNRFTKKIIGKPELLNANQLFNVQDKYLLSPWVKVSAVPAGRKRGRLL